MSEKVYLFIHLFIYEFLPWIASSIQRTAIKEGPLSSLRETYKGAHGISND